MTKKQIEKLVEAVSHMAWGDVNESGIAVSLRLSGNEIAKSLDNLADAIRGLTLKP